MLSNILLVCSLLLLFYFFHKQQEHFTEKCIKDTSNMLSNGINTFFTNEMVDTKYNLDHQYNKVVNVNNETNANLGILNNAVKSSIKKYNNNIDLYNNFNNDLVGILDELTRKLDISNSVIAGRKMGVDSKFTNITNKVNSMVGTIQSSGIENKLKPIIINQIDRELVEKATKVAEDYNVGAKMSNRINTQNSKIYEWQFVEKADDNAVLRVNAETGDVECFSYDGKNCVKDFKSKYGNNMFNIKSDEVKSLQCGADHKRQHGTTGYEDTNHWCSKAYREFSKMGEDTIDFNSCPKNWSLIEPKTKTCIAPFDYKVPKDISSDIF